MKVLLVRDPSEDKTDANDYSQIHQDLPYAEEYYFPETSAYGNDENIAHVQEGESYDYEVALTEPFQNL